MPIKVRADFAADGTWSADLSADVQAVDLRLGMRKPYQLVTDGAQCTIKLENSGRHYSPENSGGTHYPNVRPGRRVQVYWDDNGGGTSILFTGRIKPGGIAQDWTHAGTSISIQPVTLTCAGPKYILDDIEVDLNPYGETTVDVVIDEILRESGATLAANDEWVLGDSVYSILGTTTILTDAGDLDTGAVTLQSYADAQTPRAYNAIKELLDCEQGKFGFSRTGRPFFWNRHKFMGTASAAGTVDTDSGAYQAVKLSYGYGETYANEVRVNTAPRKVSGLTQTLWTMNDASLPIPAGDTLILEVDMKTSTGRKVGASTDLTTTATFLNDVECNIVVQRFGSRAKLTLDNATGTSPVTITSLTLTGSPVVDQDSHVYTARDASAIESNKLHQASANAGPTGDVDSGRYIAQYILYDRSLKGEISEIGWTFDGQGTTTPFPVNWPMGSLLSVDCSERDHTGTYAVIGEHWTWKLGKTLAVNQVLEPVNQTWWALGVAGRSEPNNTILGY